MAGSNSKLTLAELKSFSESEKELQQFINQSAAGKQIEQKIIMAVTNYMIMMEVLLYMQKKLPELLDELKAVQEKVDKRHTNSNVATVGGCATSIVGGFLFIGGLIAAPFTFGISVGFTAAGSAIIIAGTATTATAKTADFGFGKWDQRKTNKMVKEFLGHYKAAKEAYEKLRKVNQELNVMLPNLGAKNGLTKKAIISGITSAVGYARAIGRVPVTAVTTGANAFAVYQAFALPAELHAATKLALLPHKALPLTQQFFKGMADTAQCLAKLEMCELKVAGMATFRAGCFALKAVGGISAGIGIILDTVTLYSAARELYKGTQCKVSQKISQHIEMLEDLTHRLDNLHHQLDTNTKSITD